MRYRMAAWASAGALVALGWNLYILATFPTLLAARGILWAFVCMTCPIALAHHYPIRFYWVLVANAATYALIGLIVEPLRRRHS